AGEVEDFVRRLRQRYYPKVEQRAIRTYLVELGDRLLGEQAPEMGEYARRKLEARGYRVMLQTAIREVRENEVEVAHGEEQETIRTRTVIWTGGVRPAPIIAECGVETDKAGRALTAATM